MNNYLLKLPLSGLKHENVTFMEDIIQEKREFSIDAVPEPESIEDVIYSLMVNPNLSAINYFNDFSESGISPDSVNDVDNDEIGMFDIDSNGKKQAICTHAFHRHLQEDPQKSAEILISRATRKMLCMGLRPVAVSALLYHINFADPMGQFIASGAKKGLENAAQKFGLSISDRKIRFDLFPGSKQLPPSLIVSMVGAAGQNSKPVTNSFTSKGGNLFLIGRLNNDICSSEYVEFYHEIQDTPLPAFNIEDEIKIHELLNRLHERNLLQSASPVGKGGLFFTLLRSAIPSGLGFDITTDDEHRLDAFLFGESMGRILVEVAAGNEDEFVDFMTDAEFPFIGLGHITRGELRIDEKSLGFIDKMTRSS